MDSGVKILSLKDTSFQKYMPFEVLPALRNVSTDIESPSRSPLNRLIRRLKVDENELETYIARQIEAKLRISSICLCQTYRKSFEIALFK